MTKLEPTRTSSDLTATERLRRMLDKRGVEWLDDSYAQLWCTVWDGQDGKQWRMTENQRGMLTELKAWKVTPEQAIAATLGSCNCTNDCTNSERTNVPCLPHFWTHDGALHIEATRMPTRIVVCEGGTCEFVPKRELDASEDENAKLREEFNKMDVWHSKELTATMDENARLRELCADIYKRFRGVVFECWAYSSEDFRMYEQRMRELGVEVSE